MEKITKKSYLIFLVVLVITTAFSIVNAQGVINLPQTGQDEEIKAGVTLPSPHHPSLKSTVGTGAEPAGATKTRLVKGYGKLPLHFEANQGQVEGTVRFLSRGSGYGLFLTSTEAVITLRRAHQTSEKTGREAVNPVRNSSGALNPAGEQRGIISNGVNPQTGILRMKWEGANQDPTVEGVDELEGKSHYFIGNDPDQWRTNISIYRKVRYRDLYPGIDLIYYGNQRQLEYDLVVTPEGDPCAIRLVIEGAEGVEVDEGGSLILQVGGGEVIQQAPRIYQEVEGKKQLIKGGYVLDSSGKDEDKGKVFIGFKIDKFDTKKPLIIDPVLAYSTYLGGNYQDYGYGIAVDSSGSAYITGCTWSTHFPTANPIQGSNAGVDDVFVTKLNPDGSALVYSTYLGGSSQDIGYGIAVDSSGSAYITGYTNSPDFPTINPIQGSNAGGRDVFVTKLNPDGSALVYSTYFGGSSQDTGYGIAVHSSGSAYITGFTWSTDFPTANPIQGSNAAAATGQSTDVFVAKLNPSGSALVYSTYLGGSGMDYGHGIAVDSSGNAYITGETLSTNFPTVGPIQGSNVGGYDVFVAKLNSSGSALVYSTYLGGGVDDYGYGIAVDGSGSAYITGFSYSTDFPTANPIQGTLAGGIDVFVTKLNSAGSALIYSTYLGGGVDDYGCGIAVDSSENAYITGETSSTNFPIVNPVQGSLAGEVDAFVTKLNSTGSALVYSTYHGGSGTDYGHGIAVDGSGSAYITGGTHSNNFPTVNSVQGSYGGGSDAFITRLDIIETIIATNPSGLQIVVDGSTYTAPHTFDWTPGSSHTISVASPQSGASGTRYVYSSWSDGGAQNHTITAPSSSGTYTANFITQYSLTTSVNPSVAGAVTPSGTNWYDSGQNVSVSATANPGYTFGAWSGDFLGTTNPTSIGINGPKNVTANFTQNQYTLTVNIAPSGSGSVTKSPNKTTYVYGDVVTLTATANAGYTFSNWSGDATGSTNPVTVTINSDKSVTANFILLETISTPNTPTGPTSGVTDTSYSYSTGGSISNLGHTVEYQFDWKGDGSDLSAWGSGTQSKGWTVPGTYNVQARARCTIDTSVISSWSGVIAVTITTGGNGTINLPQTGQTKCYNSSGAEINCAGTGQDGESQAGVEWPEPRFTVNGDCVTDNLTGLMWAKNGNLPNGEKTWQGALDYVASINSGSGLCGYKDWRLPNVNELESLINSGEANTATWLNTQGFSNVQSDYYWSSTTYAKHTDYAEIVNMWNYGVVSNDKSYGYYVWPVLSGQGSLGHSEIWQTGQKTTYATGDDGDLEKGVSWPAPRFTDHGDETITDNLTGLMWAKNANLPNGTRTWQGALGYVETLNTGGYSDWRLPNRKELFSLFDHSKYDPALPVDHLFQSVQSDYYWSSTTYAYNTGSAWVVCMWYGYVGYNLKSSLYYVWPVRSGQGPVAETVSIPNILTGPINGTTGVAYSYTTGGSTSSLGHMVEYQFDWKGDGSDLSPWGSATQSKTWANAGTYNVRARARCTVDTSVMSGWSSGLSVIISAPETVSTPSLLSGPTNGNTGTSYTYSTGGSTSSLGHPVQYFFDWGDSTNSGWLPVGTTIASKSWAPAGSYTVKAQARCATDTSVVSNWSSGVSVTITAPTETITTPTTPSGPTSGFTGTSYSYTTGGSTSSLGHSVEYQFDWKGDGSDLSSWGSATQSKSWTLAGTYTVKARARCATHTSVMSGWSTGLSVTISTGVYTATRDLPDCYTPSVPLTVTITVTASLTAAYYWVIDTPPNGWTVSDINENGLWDSINKWVRWGFPDKNNRILTYKATPPSGETGNKTFSGRVVYDEDVVTITGDLTIDKCIGETISTPAVPSGPTSGTMGTNYTYSTGGSTSSLGHSVQYFFDWGDGTNSGWLSVGTTSASKSWTSANTYSVKAKARCATDTGVESNWSTSLSVTISGGSGVISLPWTGQTKCYDQIGTEINCSGTGQDGEIQAGVEWPNPRFIVIYCNATGPCADQNLDCDDDSSTDVITDNLTGLMWARDANLPGSGKDWLRALVYVTSLNSGNGLCGYNDWRLPNINEIGNLTNAEWPNFADWLRAQSFLNLRLDQEYYWSSTTHHYYTDNAWLIDIGDGGIYGSYKTPLNFLWPVRGGEHIQPNTDYPANIPKTGQTISYAAGDDGDLQWGVDWPDSRFTDNQDGIVKDNLTGLIWTKDANILGPHSCNPYELEDKTWPEALDFIKCLNANSYLGYSDWRLPNTGELRSLVDYSRGSLRVGYPFVNLRGVYWSSTTVPHTRHDAYTTNLGGGRNGGGMGVEGKEYARFVWPVRSGQIGGLKGNVTDVSTGNYLFSVDVSTSNKVTQTGQFGYYNLRLPSGTHDITFSKTGYQSQTFSNVVIFEGQFTELNVELQVAETVSAPSILSGPTSGTVGTSYNYSTGGSSSSLGHDVQYFFDWGDGSNSGWLPVGIASASHSWGSAGTYPVKVQARCAADTDVVSSLSSSLSVTISPATVPSTVATNPSGLQIMVDGSTYTAPHTFDWTPGSSHNLSIPSPQSGTSGTRYVYSSWSDGGAQTHTINAPSSSTTYTASFTTEYSLTTSVSPSGAGTVTPLGTNWYDSGQNVSLSATANPGYTFGAWSGDFSGTTNPTSIAMNGPKNVVANFTQNQYTLTVNIIPSGSGSVAKSPDKASYTYGEQVILTATANPGYTFSNWVWDVSGTTNPITLTVNGNKTATAYFIKIPETVSTPSVLSGPTSGTVVATSYSYTTGGSTSSYGHPVEYQFDWNGDGSNLSSWGSATQSKTWATPGTYNVRARARCTIDTSVVSSWSGTLSVTISAPETVSPPSVLGGPTTGFTGTSYSYTASGSTSSYGHQVKYQFDWKGDGSDLSSWGTSTQSKTWTTPGTYNIKARARCATHTSVVSEWSGTLSVNITSNPILTVLKSGTGSGTVTSSPAGINCGDDCSETYTKVQEVKLTAKADTNSTFTGWSGGGCSETGTCTVTVDASITVTASFALKTPDISVAQTSIEFGSVKVGKKVTKTLKITNNGSGDLWITLSGLEGTDFSIQGSGSVIIKAKKSYSLKVLCTPTSAGLKTATLKINSNDPDTPTFDIELHGSTIEQPQQFALTVTKAGTGSGTVTSNPAGINCGSDCSESYNQGTSVTLTATPASGSSFGGWSGDADCSDGVVVMNANKACTATFNPQVVGYTLTVVKSGTGSGMVSSSPVGINCGSDCSETYTKVQKVKLTAEADASSTFAGWSGGGCSGTKTCTVTVDAAVTVTADFALKTPDISVAQTSIEFGSVKVGKKVTKTLKITNNGTGDLVITFSGLEGTDFSIQGSSGVTIKAKKSYSLKVLFTPKSAGLKTATLEVESNDPDTPTIDISLSGTGQ